MVADDGALLTSTPSVPAAEPVICFATTAPGTGLEFDEYEPPQAASATAPSAARATRYRICMGGLLQSASEVEHDELVALLLLRRGRELRFANGPGRGS